MTSRCGLINLLGCSDNSPSSQGMHLQRYKILSGFASFSRKNRVVEMLNFSFLLFDVRDMLGMPRHP